jgi:hypothetical protein
MERDVYRINTADRNNYRNHCNHGLRDLIGGLCDCQVHDADAEDRYRQLVYDASLKSYKYVGKTDKTHAILTDRPGSSLVVNARTDHLTVGDDVNVFGSKKFAVLRKQYSDNAPYAFTQYPEHVSPTFVSAQDGMTYSYYPDASMLYNHSAYTILPERVCAALEATGAMYADVVLHKYVPTTFDLRLLFAPVDPPDHLVEPSRFDDLVLWRAARRHLFTQQAYTVANGLGALAVGLYCGQPDPAIQAYTHLVDYNGLLLRWQCHCGHSDPMHCIAHAVSMFATLLGPERAAFHGLKPHYLFHDELPYFYFPHVKRVSPLLGALPDPTSLLVQFSRDELPIVQLVYDEWYHHFQYSADQLIIGRQTPNEYFTNNRTVANHALPQFAPEWMGDRAPCIYTSNAVHTHEWTVHIRIVRSHARVVPNLWQLFQPDIPEVTDVAALRSYVRAKCLYNRNEPTRRALLARMAVAHVESKELLCTPAQIAEVVDECCRPDAYYSMKGMMNGAMDSIHHTMLKLDELSVAEIPGYISKALDDNITELSHFRAVLRAIGDAGVWYHVGSWNIILIYWYQLSAFCLRNRRDSLVWAKRILMFLFLIFVFISAVVSTNAILQYLRVFLDFTPHFLFYAAFVAIFSYLGYTRLIAFAFVHRVAAGGFVSEAFEWFDVYYMAALLIVCLIARPYVRARVSIVTKRGLVYGFLGLHYRSYLASPVMVANAAKGMRLGSLHDVDPIVQMRTHGPHFDFYDPVILDTTDPYNEKLTLEHRVFRARPEYSDSEGEAFYNWVRDNLKDIFPVERVRPISRRDWVGKFRARRRLEYEQAYADFVYYRLPFEAEFFNNLRINDFIKREPLIQSQFKSGRNIGGRTADYNLLWGNLTETVSKILISLSKLPDSPINYSSGFNRSEMGHILDSWVQHVEEFDEYVCHFSDFSKYDLTVNEWLLAVESMVYRHFCFVDALHDYVLDEMQYRIYGRTRYHKFDLNRAGPYRMLVSGNVNTSIGNSLRTLLMRVYQACKVMRCSYRHLSTLPYRIMALGDDSLAITTPTIANSINADDTLELLGMDATQGVARLPAATFCSSVFVPTTEGSLMLPLIGRYLAKTFYNVHNIGPKKVAGYCRGIINGLRFDYWDMPIIRVIHKHIGRVTRGIKPWIPPDRSITRPHADRTWYCNDDTWDFLYERYGLDRATIIDFEQQLGAELAKCSSCVYALDHPIFRTIFEIDNEFVPEAVDPTLSDLVASNRLPPEKL